MRILVTGGAGFIGSHAVVELLNAKHEVVVLDNFSNSSPHALKRISDITGKKAILIEGDLRDRDCLTRLFKDHTIDAVMHFAGLKAVGESVEQPLAYYENNITGSLRLFQAMQKAEVFHLVFSSSATVYGDPQEIPITENCPTSIPSNPYGTSKLMIERIIKDLTKTDERWAVALLRYFNPIGAHPSGLIGEDPNGIPNNLMPYITQVAVGKLEQLSVYGDDYPTKDGTGIRDYIHVVDLVKGHLSALYYLQSNTGCHTWNLGNGTGYSVLEVINAFEKVTGIKIEYRLTDRRPGDIAECWSNPRKAHTELGWRNEYKLVDMMRDSWNWQQKNPNGYGEE